MVDLKCRRAEVEQWAQRLEVDMGSSVREGAVGLKTLGISCWHVEDVEGDGWAEELAE